MIGLVGSLALAVGRLDGEVVALALIISVICSGDLMK